MSLRNVCLTRLGQWRLWAEGQQLVLSHQAGTSVTWISIALCSCCPPIITTPFSFEVHQHQHRAAANNPLLSSSCDGLCQGSAYSEQAVYPPGLPSPRSYLSPTVYHKPQIKVIEKKGQQQRPDPAVFQWIVQLLLLLVLVLRFCPSARPLPYTPDPQPLWALGPPLFGFLPDDTGILNPQT